MAVLYLKYIESGLPILVHGLLCVLAYVFWLLCALVCIPIMILYRLYNCFESKLISYRNLGTVFHPFDIPFLHETEKNRNFIMAIIELDGGDIKINKLRKLVTERYLDRKGNLDKTYQRLSQKVSKCFSSYIWEEEKNFSIRQHMPIYKGPPIKSKEDLELLCSNWANQPFPKDISPWMFKIVVKEDRSGFYLVAKVHHVIGDGYALIGLLSEIVDEKPKFMKISSKASSMMSNQMQRVISGVLTGPLALLTLGFSRNLRNPFKAEKAISKKTVSWTNPIELDAIKKLKTKTILTISFLGKSYGTILPDTTVNDVVMSCLAGALRSYLNGKGVKAIDQPIAMTFNSRSIKEKAKIQIPLGNNSGGIFLNLPISVEDPLLRLNITKSRIDLLKTLSHPHVFSFVYFNIVSGLPDFLSRQSTFAMRQHTSLIVSNVPGPTSPVYILGVPVKSIVFTPPLHADIGLVASVFSYDGKLHLTIMSDESIVQEPTDLTQAFEKEIYLLRDRLLYD